MKEKHRNTLNKWKYEVLLIALIIHLYIGAVLPNLDYYTSVIWPINMLVLGVASIGVFVEKGKWKQTTRSILFAIVFLLPISRSFFGHVDEYLIILSLIYFALFVFIFIEVIRFLVKPSYINRDIISASACGYFLLIEVSVFLLQVVYYSQPSSFPYMVGFDPATTFMDLVYFCTVSVTTIGYGDITPEGYQTKLIVSLFGVIGQFYSVVLVGILISKFTNRKKPSPKE